MFIKVLHVFSGVSLGPVACEAVVIDAEKTISVLNQYNRLKKVIVMLVHNLMALRGRYCLYAPECQRHRKMDDSEFHRLRWCLRVVSNAHHKSDSDLSSPLLLRK